MGWVESTRGAPVAGAVVSIFGKGIRGGSLLTLADGQGHFALPSLPAGSYTLRAIGTGHQPSAAQHVTVLPNRDALFTLSLTPVGEKPADEAASTEAASEGEREWKWLVRHKQRSVLETADDDVRAAQGAPAPALPETAPLALGPVAGSMELAAMGGTQSLADAAGAGLPGGVGSLQLQGQLVDGVRWSLGGLVAENEGRTWRTAAEFVLEPGGGHEVEVGAGYGAGDVRATLRRRRARAQPHGGSGVRPGPLAARRAADRDHRRPLHLHRLPARFAPRRRGGADRASRGPADPRARLGRHPHPDPGRRPADAVDGGGLAGHHVGSARRGPAPGALAALRGGRRPRARRRPHRGAGLHRDDARLAAHDLRRLDAVRPQRRKPRGPGLRRDRGPPVRRRRERLGHLHVRPGPPRPGPRASRTWP